MEYPKKLIEVALPLDDINLHSIKEKNPFLKNHPRSLHLWWARRPLASARAVLFAQLVNDPGGTRGWGKYKGQTKEDAQRERERLFEILRELIKWENLNNEDLIQKARCEIQKSWEETCKITGEDLSNFPRFMDPFAGGGAIPLEALRFGLKVNAFDLNPVSVLINKALIELPFLFLNKEPIWPDLKLKKQEMIINDKWMGASGLAEDICRYGNWLCNEAKRKIGHFYPEISIPTEYGGGKGTVIAWLWARTVKSPTPIFSDCHVPLVRSFYLSTKKDNLWWIKPKVDREEKVYSFEIESGVPDNPEEISLGTRLGGRANFRCIYSNAPIESKYIKNQGIEGKFGNKLLAVAVQVGRKRIFLPGNKDMEDVANQAIYGWSPNQKFIHNSRHLTPSIYGLDSFNALFSKRQLAALSIFLELIEKLKTKVFNDSISAGMKDDDIHLKDKGTGAKAYSETIATYLSLALSQYTRYHATTAIWNTKNINVAHTFGRQALPMTWDYAESNPFEGSLTFETAAKWVASSIKNLNFSGNGKCYQSNASEILNTECISNNHYIISTDPPYYDNVPYADLADFFYVWLRPSVSKIFPELFKTLLTPKAEELVADSFRHDNKINAEEFFMSNMLTVMCNLYKLAHPAYPVTIYYAYKQSEKKLGSISKGWEAFLDGVIHSGFCITGTWPINTEDASRLRSQGSNALASSIIIVCRKRPYNANTISRKQFNRELGEILPDAIEDMIGGKEFSSPIAPVDLAQAAIGPGMAVFSKYNSILEADGTPMSVHNALILINKTIDEYFTEAEGDMDEDTRFCINWFQQYGFKEGVFGEADVLARAKGTSVDGVQDAGVILAQRGKVRLIKVSEYPQDWDPKTDKRMPVWEACHHMCRALQIGESVAGKLIAQMPEKTEAIRQLAYRLYTLCERKGWAEDAGIYNGLITSWHAILEESHKVGHKPIEGTQKPLGI